MTPNRSGRHFLQIPGPTNVPDRVLRAMAQPTIDHRGAEFAALGARGARRAEDASSRRAGPVVIFPASGTGAWEAALVNTLSPGDKVLAFEIGEFARLWAEVARRLGLEVEVVDTRLARAASIPRSSRRGSRADREHRIKAVLVVHNETSTGATSRLPEIRRAIDRGEHPALLLVDAVSSLGSIDLRHDEWGIDVTLAGSQKGLMLPPGLSFNAISEKALAASRTATPAEVVLGVGADARGECAGLLPVHAVDEPALRPARRRCAMLHEEGLEQRVRAARAAGGGGPRGGARVGARDSAASATDEYSPRRHHGDDAGRTRRRRVPRASSLDRFNLSLGAGLGRLKGRAFRIGHLGDFNELMLTGTLCGVEMGLRARRRAVHSAAASTRRWTDSRLWTPGSTASGKALAEARSPRPGA